MNPKRSIFYSLAFYSWILRHLIWRGSSQTSGVLGGFLFSAWKPISGGTEWLPRAFASLWAGFPVLISDQHYFCPLGYHLWKWSRETRSSLVYRSQLLPLSWGKNIQKKKKSMAYKTFKIFVNVFHICLLLSYKSCTTK
jgi:hypothetical protein